MIRATVVGLAFVLQISIFSQDAVPAGHTAMARRSLIVPNARPLNRVQPVRVTAVRAGVVILEQSATTTLEIDLQNPSDRAQEAEVLLPVPENAVLRAFDFQGSGKEPAAKLIPHAEARRTYDSIVSKLNDPALLEFVGCNLIRSSVFPVPANGTQRVRITYEQLLAADGNRVDYILPRSEALDFNVPWTINVKVQAAAPISTVYSPSHEIETVRTNANLLGARVATTAAKPIQPGPFQLSYLKEGDGVSASLFAYPDPSIGGGYFLLLAGLPVKAADATHASPQRREVTLVIDTSGSMAGEKLEQVRKAALQVLSGLQPGEAFNIITYNNSVEMFSPTPVLKDDQTAAAAEKFIRDLSVYGGTNIYEALTEALKQPPTATMLPLVLFLTDGVPTIGKTAEKDIRALAVKHNPHNRRVFTFGVGTDINTPLLERIASETRATASFVLPKENVTEKMNAVYRRLSGPVFSDLKLGHEGFGCLYASADKINDLFEGDQLVLLGQYVEHPNTAFAASKPVSFTINGSFLGAPREFRFNFDLSKASTKNSFVPRLWASRKIEALIDIIRQAGGDINDRRAAADDPNFKTIVDEIVSLSTKFGVLTEYTAFLALEGTDLNQKDAVLAEAQAKFQQRAVGDRSGAAAVNQEVNKQNWKEVKCLNRANGYFDESMKRVEVSGVQQISDRTFYRRNGQWVDSRVAEDAVKPKREIEFGSEEHKKLVTKLASENRQACAALNGDVLLLDGGEAVLIKAPKPAVPATAGSTVTAEEF